MAACVYTCFFFLLFIVQTSKIDEELFLRGTPAVHFPLLKFFSCKKKTKMLLSKDVLPQLSNHKRLEEGKKKLEYSATEIKRIVLACEMTVMYLFTRYRFNWNEVDFSIFSTYSMITNLIGTTISVGVFSHMLKIDDALIGVMSCMSKILAGFVYAFATSTWMIYLAPLVDIVNGTSFIAMRSIASKLVPPDELGKINSVFGLAEAIVPVIYGPMYSALYAATMDTVPGAFFLVGGALTAPAVAIFLWMYTEHRKDAARLARSTNVDQTHNGTAEPTKYAESSDAAVYVITKPKSFDNKAFEADSVHSKL